MTASVEEVAQSLALGLRVLAAYELDDPFAGVLTAAIPSEPGRFVCNPVATPWELMRASDLVFVAAGQTVSETGQPFNELAVANNLGLFDRPDTGGVVHIHAPSALKLAAIGRRLEPYSQEACIFYNDHEVVADRFELNFDRTSWLRDSIGDSKVLAIANHGLIAQGQTINEAVAWAIRFEQAAAEYLSLLSLAVDYSLIPDAAAEGFRRSNGTSDAGWLHFQTFADLANAGTW